MTTKSLSALFGVTGAAIMCAAPALYRHPSSMAMAGLMGVILLMSCFAAIRVGK